MEIIWLADGGLRLSSRTAVLVIDSPRPPAKCDVALYSRGLDAAERAALADGPFVIDTPGEFEVHGAFVIAVQASRLPSTAEHESEADRCQVICVELDGVQVCHLGGLGRKLSKAQVEALGEVHALFLPLQPLGPSLAAELVAQIEPPLVVPLAPGAGDETPSGDVAKFLEEMAAPVEAAEARLVVDLARLPGEPTVVRLRPAV